MLLKIEGSPFFAVWALRIFDSAPLGSRVFRESGWRIRSKLRILPFSNALWLQTCTDGMAGTEFGAGRLRRAAMRFPLRHAAFCNLPGDSMQYWMILQKYSRKNGDFH